MIVCWSCPWFSQYQSLHVDFGVLLVCPHQYLSPSLLSGKRYSSHHRIHSSFLSFRRRVVPLFLGSEKPGFRSIIPVNITIFHCCCHPVPELMAFSAHLGSDTLHWDVPPSSPGDTLLILPRAWYCAQGCSHVCILSHLTQALALHVKLPSSEHPPSLHLCSSTPSWIEKWKSFL